MAQEDDFTDAFNGDDQAQEQVSEDQAFGIEDEPTEESQAIDEAGETTEAVVDAPVIEDGESAVSGEAQTDTASVVMNSEEEEPTDPKELQRMKSWEGRLKAREAELKAREDAMKKPEEDSPESVSTEVKEAVAEAAEAVEAGDMTMDQALAGLSESFGEDFTKMISAFVEKKVSEIAGKVADERFGKVKGEIDGLADEIVADKAAAHTETIADAHPDFMDVAQSAEFKAYIDGLDAMEQPKAMQVIQKGSARQIVKLLDKYKADTKRVDPPKEDPAMDAAEGVRSKGLKIPEKPMQSDDFAAAFDQF